MEYPDGQTEQRRSLEELRSELSATIDRTIALQREIEDRIAREDPRVPPPRRRRFRLIRGGGIGTAVGVGAEWMRTHHSSEVMLTLAAAMLLLPVTDPPATPPSAPPPSSPPVPGIAPEPPGEPEQTPRGKRRRFAQTETQAVEPSAVTEPEHEQPPPPATKAPRWPTVDLDVDVPVTVRPPAIEAPRTTAAVPPPCPDGLREPDLERCVDRIVDYLSAA